jgi:hypothetical protein
MARKKPVTNVAVQKGGCTCDKCKQACHNNPGWMTPAEARAAIKAGNADKLMLDYLLASPENVFVLCPASRGRGGDRAPNSDELYGDADFLSRFLGIASKGRCVFHEDNGNCALHDTDYKPTQCRDDYLCTDEGPDNYDMAKHWESAEAKALVREWMALVSLEAKTLDECF